MDHWAALEAGFTVDGAAVHAVKRTVQGRRALCGAGPILRLRTGRLEAEDSQSCPACRAEVEKKRATQALPSST